MGSTGRFFRLKVDSAWSPSCREIDDGAAFFCDATNLEPNRAYALQLFLCLEFLEPIECQAETFIRTVRTEHNGK
ncbi:unnamed protein product [Dibothriocephalus latus]|uniref:Uncharacterized protein n=1 Tax=Dibothriocephalus latus TaxID=60516 RepID=A0A3P7NAG6_DIBLA|nr:unnamed protein product [Dibothriocephalus latus]